MYRLPCSLQSSLGVSLGGPSWKGKADAAFSYEDQGNGEDSKDKMDGREEEREESKTNEEQEAQKNEWAVRRRRRGGGQATRQQFSGEALRCVHTDDNPPPTPLSYCHVGITDLGMQHFKCTGPLQPQWWGMRFRQSRAFHAHSLQGSTRSLGSSASQFSCGGLACRVTYVAPDGGDQYARPMPRGYEVEGCRLCFGGTHGGMKGCTRQALCTIADFCDVPVGRSIVAN